MKNTMKKDKEKDKDKDKDKKRLLDIFFRAVKGQGIRLADIMEEYDISSRTFGRDKEIINSFLADNQAIKGTDAGLELKYERKDREYRMDTDYFFSDEEVMALVKILIGSRALSYEDLARIIEKMSRFTTPSDRVLLKKLIKKEEDLYCEIHMDCGSLLKNHWKLTKCIERGREITIQYLRMDRKEISPRVKPMSIAFTDYYFYLIAAETEREETIPKYYRIDRITGIREHEDVRFHGNPAAFDEEQLRKKSLLMWPGPARSITFEFTGPSLQAILDKLPTATYREEGGKCIVDAEVYGDGIKMFLLSQGSWVKVLGPESFVYEMKEEIRKINRLYGLQTEEEKVNDEEAEIEQ